MAFVNAGSSGNTELHHRLMETVQQALTTTSTPGAVVALLLDGQPVFVSGVGFRDLHKPPFLTHMPSFTFTA
jgi:hypothetical protein